MTHEHRIGVDLGGTKIEAVVLELGPAGAPPVERARDRTATNRELGYEHVVDATRALIATVARSAGVDPARVPIGVGMPGATTMRRADGARSDVPLVKNSNTTCLNGRPFHEDLARVVGRPIAFANDANCFALAEATWGAARGARVTFGVIMGTGVGGGLVVTNGGTPVVWNGAQGIAGEWGHVVLDADRGAPCYCGRRGCIETYLSGPAIESEYHRRSSTELSLAQIASRARSREDPIAVTLMSERIDVFGRAIATVIDIVDPDVVVLGGGASNVDALYDEGVQAAARWVFNDELLTKIVKHELGDSAGVLGAALLTPPTP
jgi:fructokinase